MPKQSRNQINEGIKQAQDWRSLYLGREDEPKTRGKLRHAVGVRTEVYTTKDKAALRAMATALGFPPDASPVDLFDYAVRAVPHWPSLKVAHFVDFLWKPTFPPRGFMWDKLDGYCDFWRDTLTKDQYRQFSYPTVLGDIAGAFSFSESMCIPGVKQARAKDGADIKLLLIKGGQPKDLKTMAIQLRLDENLPEDEVKGFVSLFLKEFDDYTLQALLLIFYKCHMNDGKTCLIDANEDLDLLGYTRDKLNRHDGKQRTKYLKTVDTLLKYEWLIQVTARPTAKKDTSIDFEGPLFHLEMKETHRKGGRVVKKRRYVSLSQGMVKLFKRGLFAWQGTGIFHVGRGIAKRVNPRVVRLSLWINSQLAQGYSQHGGRMVKPLHQIVRETRMAELPKDPSALRRHAEKIKQDFEYITQNVGDVKSIKAITEDRNPFAVKYEFIIADNHNLRKKLRSPSYERLNGPGE